MENIEGLIISKQNKDISNVTDLYLNNFKTLKNYSSIDIDLGFYPYNRKIDSNDFKFLPYEEYINDVIDGQRSIYSQVKNSTDKFFGASLAIIIFTAFFIFKREEIYSLQSIVTAFGAYTIGKEIWNDLSQTLINLTKKLRVRFKDRKHYYALETPDTLARYFKFARSKRYHASASLPDKLDLISQSNSKEVELRFSKNTIKEINSENLHLLTIQFNPQIIKNLETGYFLIVGLSFNSTKLFLTKEIEIFQAIDNKRIGIQNDKGEWFDKSYLIRTSYSLFGRIKFYGKSKIVSDSKIIKQSDS